MRFLKSLLAKIKAYFWPTPKPVTLPPVATPTNPLPPGDPIWPVPNTTPPAAATPPAPPAPTPAPVANPLGLYAYDPITLTCRIGYRDALPQDVKDCVAKANVRGNDLYPILGERFHIPAAIEVFGLDEVAARVIRRSCFGAGLLEANNGRWCYADLYSPQLIPGATAIRGDEDPIKVIDQLVGYAMRDGC